MLTVHAIDPTRLAAIRDRGQDERGNPLQPFAAAGWEPLRCCLTLPSPGDPVALIAYSPFPTSSPWAETGPVYVHPATCPGYGTPEALPPAFRTGPRILRTYRADGSLAYEHIAAVPDGVDLEPAVRAALAVDEVATVHVRAVLSQCFTYAVTR
jgi:hypothetical protein